MGEIENNALEPINLQINSFCVQCRRNLNFLEKFREQVDKLESSFDYGWGSDPKLNAFFSNYEKDVLTDYLLSLNSENKNGVKGLVREGPNSNIMSQSDTSMIDGNTFMLFENKGKQHLKQELQDLPRKLDNPYQILKRFIRWEIMDLEAMIETLESKSTMD